jgi:hypothetical protein
MGLNDFLGKAVQGAQSILNAVPSNFLTGAKAATNLLASQIPKKVPTVVTAKPATQKLNQIATELNQSIMPSIQNQQNTIAQNKVSTPVKTQIQQAQAPTPIVQTPVQQPTAQPEVPQVQQPQEKTVDQLIAEYTGNTNQAPQVPQDRGDLLYTDPSGRDVYRNDLLTKTETSITPEKPVEGSSGWYEQKMLENNALIDKSYNDFKAEFDSIKNGTFPLTAFEQAQVQAIQDSAERAKQAQLTANKNYEGAITQATISGGRNRYAPELALGEVKSAVDQGLAKIREIDSKAAQAVSELKSAFQNKHYDAVLSAYDRYSGFMKERQTQIGTMYNAAIKHEDELVQAEQDQKKQEMQIRKDAVQYDLDKQNLSLKQKQQIIDQALSEKKISMEQAKDLQDYQLKKEQLNQGDYQTITDAYGRPSIFNKKTGKIEAVVPNTAQGISDGVVGIKQQAAAVLQDAIFSATTSLPKNERESILSQYNLLVERGDFNKAKELLTKVAVQSLGGAQQTEALKRLNRIEQLNNALSVTEEYTKQYGSTGLLNGTLEQVINKLGKTTDPKLLELRSIYTQLLQEYRADITGAAFGEQEASEYNALSPNIKDTPEVAKTKMYALLNTLQKNQKSVLGYSIGNENYEKIFGGKPIPTDLKTLYHISEPNVQKQIESIKVSDPSLTDQDIYDIMVSNYSQPTFNNDLSMSQNGFTQKVSSEYPKGSTGGQCGDFAHKLVEFPSVGDSLQQKLNSIDKFGIPANEWKQSPQVGDVLITKEAEKTGHVAVVNKVLPDGSVQLSESNYYQKSLGPEKVSHTRILDKNSPVIYGAIRGQLKK